MDSIECTKQKIRVVIAALGHDIQRALAARKLKRADFPEYDSFKAAHARISAGILRGIMEDCGVPQEMSDKVYGLVPRHETGGDDRSDLIKNADKEENQNLCLYPLLLTNQAAVSALTISIPAF